jgi:hypothetical protein
VANSKFKPDVPDGYLSLEMAARRLGLARQTVLNQVRAGQRDAIQVVNGKRRGLRIHVADTDALCWGSDTSLRGTRLSVDMGWRLSSRQR